VTDEFGSPRELDAVARIEKAFGAAMERVKTHYQAVQPVYPRAIGSQAVSPDDEFAEFTAAIADNPQGVATLLGSWRQQHGDGEALKMLAEYVERNERRLGRLTPQ